MGIVTMGLPGPMPAGCRRVMKGWGETREGIAEGEIFQDEKICGGGRHRFIHRHRVPNGCARPVFRPERSRDWVLWPVGNDAASSAQSKRAEGGRKGCLQPRWGERGCAGGNGGTDGGRGVSRGVDSVVSDAVGL